MQFPIAQPVMVGQSLVGNQQVHYVGGNQGFVPLGTTYLPGAGCLNGVGTPLLSPGAILGANPLATFLPGNPYLVGSQFAC